MGKRTGEHQGCLVTGRVLGATGEVAIDYLIVTPERGAMVNGIWYPAQSARVQIEPDGRWNAVLLPSSAVGEYNVRIGREMFDMRVPNTAEARFEDIVKVNDAKIGKQR